LLSICLQTRRL